MKYVKTGLFGHQESSIIMKTHTDVFSYSLIKYTNPGFATLLVFLPNQIHASIYCLNEYSIS